MTVVSIVTPSYNQADFLEQTICSVLEQDHPHVEYIVIDGASTDGSVEIIQKYAHRLTHWVSEPDHGQADAINKGMARATGEVIAWLNSDDTYLPGAIRSAADFFEHDPHLALVYGDMLAVDEHSRPLNRLRYRQYTLEDLLCFQIIGQPAVFMRRSAFKRAGGLDPTFHYMLDHHLWIRLAQLGRIMHVPQTWASARYHPRAKNRALAPEFGRDADRIFEWARREPSLAEAFLRVARRARASVNRVNARYLLDAGQPSRALWFWMQAFLVHPPTAMARMNILASALLNLLGLTRVREMVLRRRLVRHSR